jgi:4-carboxymuconolactone decarboxylase
MGINAMEDGKTESRTQRGIRLIREMLGEASKTRMERNAAAGFGARFTQLAVDFVFGTLWADAVLPRRDLSLVTIGALVAARQYEELEHHVRIGLANGLTAAEIEEAITHLAVYCGFPAARLGLATAGKVIEEDGR